MAKSIEIDRKKRLREEPGKGHNPEDIFENQTIRARAHSSSGPGGIRWGFEPSTHA